MTARDGNLRRLGELGAAASLGERGIPSQGNTAISEGIKMPCASVTHAGIEKMNGADGETRTPTACATSPSSWRVYQFHHVGGKRERTGLTGLKPNHKTSLRDFDPSC